MSSKHRRQAIRLTITEARDILESLRDSQHVKGLDRVQRHHLGDVTGSLQEIIENSDGKNVDLPVTLVYGILRCVTMSQAWLRRLDQDLEADGE